MHNFVSIHTILLFWIIDNAEFGILYNVIVERIAIENTKFCLKLNVILITHWARQSPTSNLHVVSGGNSGNTG